jgi:sirohydrochlorin cobaltochelatase
MVLSLLISHGSRDPRPQLAIESLALELSVSLNRPVASAVLELGAASLHDQILALQDQFPSHETFQILPLFLLPGAHTMEDIPAELALVTERIVSQGRSPLTLEPLPYLGAGETLWPCSAAQRASLRAGALSKLSELSELSELSKLSKLSKLSNGAVQAEPPAALILLAHGSRRAGGNGPVESLAEHLGAVAAYWSLEPSLKTVVEQVAKSAVGNGVVKIQILPHFLFPGGITDAIAEQIEGLQTEHPGLAIEMGPLLSQTPAFVSLLYRQLSGALL